MAYAFFLLCNRTSACENNNSDNDNNSDSDNLVQYITPVVCSMEWVTWGLWGVVLKGCVELISAMTGHSVGAGPFRVG